MDWQVAGYLRLSRDDGIDGVSESINNQKSFIKSYAKQNNLTIKTWHTDDGVSGTTFDRKGFNQMLADIERGDINCVITKDFSRLGRDYIKAGYYLEDYFPRHGVRYIAITDGMDSLISSSNDITPFRAVLNDMYAKDISKKVRAAISTKRQQGQFIGSIAPYGYAKNPLNKNQLLIDEETAVVVRRIFSLVLQGEMLLGIANILSKEGVPTPSQQKGLTATQKRFAGVWNDGMIKRILTSQTYIGNVVQRRSEVISYKVAKKRNIPQDEWVIVENTHEPIVSKEDFERVQTILANRQYSNHKRGGQPHLLSGLVYCQDCGAPMSFVKESETRSYLCCSTWRKHAKLKVCTSHCIREQLVENAIKGQLRQLAEQLVSFDDVLGTGVYDFASEQKELLQCRNRLRAEDRKLVQLYTDKLSGKLPEAQFVIISESFTKTKQQLEQRITELETRINKGNDMVQLQGQLKELLQFEELDRAMLLVLVHKVIIGKDKEILIQLNFSDVMER